jgi:predicted helicase
MMRYTPPPKAYGYIVKGKSAIKWIMERSTVVTYKGNSIKNTPDNWPNECQSPLYAGLDFICNNRQYIKTVDNCDKIAKDKI